MSEYYFPIPNDKLAEFTVVASVHYSSAEDTGLPNDFATVLLLAPETPFFRVAIVECVKDDPQWDYEGIHENIVPAVQDYEQNGGDW